MVLDGRLRQMYQGKLQVQAPYEDAALRRDVCPMPKPALLAQVVYRGEIGAPARSTRPCEGSPDPMIVEYSTSGSSAPAHADTSAHGVSPQRANAASRAIHGAAASAPFRRMQKLHSYLRGLNIDGYSKQWPPQTLAGIQRQPPSIRIASTEIARSYKHEMSAFPRTTLPNLATIPRAQSTEERPRRLKALKHDPAAYDAPFDQIAKKNLTQRAKLKMGNSQGHCAGGASSLIKVEAPQRGMTGFMKGRGDEAIGRTESNVRRARQ